MKAFICSLLLATTALFAAPVQPVPNTTSKTFANDDLSIQVELFADELNSAKGLFRSSVTTVTFNKPELYEGKEVKTIVRLTGYECRTKVLLIIEITAFAPNGAVVLTDKPMAINKAVPGSPVEKELNFACEKPAKPRPLDPDKMV